MTSKEINKYAEVLRQCKELCLCGHRVYVDRKRGYGICDWCGRKVYRNKRMEFRDKLKQKMKEINNE